MKEPKKIVEIRVNILKDDDLQAWAQTARAQHVKLPEYVKQVMRDNIAVRRPVGEVLEEMHDMLSSMNQTIADLTRKALTVGVAPQQQTPQDLQTDAINEVVEELFSGADVAGWE